MVTRAENIVDVDIMLWWRCKSMSRWDCSSLLPHLIDNTDDTCERRMWRQVAGWAECRFYCYGTQLLKGTPVLKSYHSDGIQLQTITVTVKPPVLQRSELGTNSTSLLGLFPRVTISHWGSSPFQQQTTLI
ncbi:hypothetical protein L1887_27588 [Cichorium endivia]|nr:hypothetical protein L1887_27588 [Cichorium endivia]